MLAGGSLALLAAIGAQRLIAQIEGERGIAPVASSQDIHVTGIVVNVSADTADEARTEGWKVAQRKAWEKIHGPKISDAQLDSMVSAIVIEHEQVGPRRYVARLGVIFDRTRAGQFVGAADGGLAARSAPMLVIPVLYSGGARQVFEVRGPWQRAWANFQTSASRVDYIRPTGAGGESLILNAGQPGRRSRIWWRNVLDQFNAADVVVPVARLDRQWPGGPVRGTFTARYGPDNTFIESFTLTARNDNEVPAMLDKALVRIDGIYQRALADGMLQPDPSLMAEQHALDAMLAQLASKLAPMIADAPDSVASAAPSSLPAATASTSATVATYTVQFATPDAAAVDSALAAVRNASGVQGAATTSLAIGGTSVMRVTVTGSLDSLAAALRAQGWQVAVGANALRISR
ncbi:MAG TPA: heavy-metal-associated domain-containing protein [Novosphingobium sp.]|nr:heavy-metal-associated domain-containing protein [Novosphingobium sp.]